MPDAPRHRPEADSTVDPELVELVLRYFDDELESDEVGELHARLRKSSVDRDAFAAFGLHAQLLREAAAPERLAALVPASVVDSPLRPAPVERRTRVTRRLAVIGSAAAVLVAAFFWGQHIASRPKPIATLVQAIDASWPEGAIPLEVGAELGAGALHLLDGIVQLQLGRGTSVTLEGPGELELVSEDLARLRSGRLAATVSSAARGFEFETPALRVVDPATAFGLHVDAQGTTDVCVFEGELEVETPPKKNRRKRKKRVGHRSTVRAATTGATIAAAEYDAKPYSRAWRVHAGIVRTAGMIRFAPPGPPESLLEYEDDERLVILPEKKRVSLKGVTRVNILRPGEYRGRGVNATGKLKADGRVHSFLVQFNPVGRGAKKETRRLVGTVEFQRPIVGIITSTKLLMATDRKLGGHGERFEAPQRGLERQGGREADTLTLAADRRSLTLDLRVSGAHIDQLRVLVDATKPK